MIPATKTLAAIDASIVATKETPFRRHLGASLMGDSCLRRLWYVFRWTLAEEFEPRMLRLFQRGHLEEDRFVSYLRTASCEVWTHDERRGLKNGKPQQFTFSDLNGHFGGSPDAVVRNCPDLPPGTVALGEFKTHNAKSFEKLQTEGLMRSKWKHFVQVQLNMHYMGFNWDLYCAVNKDTDALFIELVRRDLMEAPKQRKRAELVIFSEQPPARVNESPGCNDCRFCHLRRLCHFGDVEPVRNCRTCKHGEPSSDPTLSGLWECRKHRTALDEKAQREACNSYEVRSTFKRRGK